MSKEINAVKSVLLILFKEGKSEVEAFENISESHKTHPISLNQVKKWFKKFRTDERNLNNKKYPGNKPNFTDEFLIKLINGNPELNLTELAKLAGISQSTISNRLKEINIDGERVNYIKKSSQSGTVKLTEEFLIKLIKENPGLNTYELAKIADTSQSTISVRLRQINKSRPTEDKIVLQKKVKEKKSSKIISDEYLIGLVNDNPEFNMTMLAKLAGTSTCYISARLKQINSSGKVANYSSKKSQTGTAKLTDESLVNLIEENPGLNAEELAKIANSSQSTIYRKLKQINSNRPTENKIILQKSSVKLSKNRKSISDEFIIKLINENPGLNLRELAKLGGVSASTILLRLKLININGEKANYICKKSLNRKTKLTNETLINLIDENPGISASKLATISNSSQSTIYYKLKQINSNREGGDKIVLQKDKAKLIRRPKKITDEALIKLVSENPELNMTELAKLAGITRPAISMRIKLINRSREENNIIVLQKDKAKLGKCLKKIPDEALIKLVSENPELNMTELAKLAGISQPTMSIRLKAINSNREEDDKIILLKDKTRLRRRPKKISDEALIKLVNENPELNMKELAKLAGISRPTISKKLKLINSDGEKVKYVSKR